jgi:hypothetical protein
MKKRTELTRTTETGIKYTAVIARLMFWITFKKVPKKQFGRCVTCAANKLCYKIKVCKCNDEQQYDLRLNRL